MTKNVSLLVRLGFAEFVICKLISSVICSSGSVPLIVLMEFTANDANGK